MPEHETFTGTTPVYNWMIRLAVWVIGVLGTGAILTIVSCVNWCFWIQSDLGNVKAAQAAAKIKEDDMVSAMNTVRQTLVKIERDIEVIKARTP